MHRTRVAETLSVAELRLDAFAFSGIVVDFCPMRSTLEWLFLLAFVAVLIWAGVAFGNVSAAILLAVLFIAFRALSAWYVRQREAGALSPALAASQQVTI